MRGGGVMIDGGCVDYVSVGLLETELRVGVIERSWLDDGRVVLDDAPGAAHGVESRSLVC